MALNKKLIILSGVGLVVTGAAAGVIGYKASMVADGQDQMDDSNASMGGQLSFGLASPLAGFAGTAGAEFMTNIGAQIAADAAKGHISYVNLSDELQGDLITGVAHTVNMVAPGTPADTKVGDPQSALNATLKGLIGANPKTAPALAIYKPVDHEIAGLRAADIRRMLNNDLSKERMEALHLDDAKIKTIHDDIANATVISLNVGINDIIEAASQGTTFAKLVMNQFANPTKPASPNLGTLMGGLTSGGDSVMESAIDSVGNLNGALSAIRRLNPNAKIALGMLGTYGNPAIDDQLKQINNAIQVAALTQDIKSGYVSVAPMDPMAKQFTSPLDGKTQLSLQDMYQAEPNHAKAAGAFQQLMTQMAQAAAAKAGTGK